MNPTWEQLRDAHDHFAGAAAGIVDSGQEVHPQLFLLSFARPGKVSVDVVPPEVVAQFFQSQEGKEQLAGFIQAVLTEGSPLRAQLAQQVGSAPQLVVQLTEAWALEHPTQEEADRLNRGESRVSAHPNKVEILGVFLHMAKGTITMSHRILAGPPRRCELAPFYSESEMPWSDGAMAMPYKPGADEVH